MFLKQIAKKSRSAALVVVISGNLLAIAILCIAGIVRKELDAAMIANMHWLWGFGIPSAFFIFAHTKLSSWRNISYQEVPEIPVLGALAILTVAIGGAVIVLTYLVFFTEAVEVPIGVSNNTMIKDEYRQFDSVISYVGWIFSPLLMFAFMIDVFAVPKDASNPQ